VNRLNHTSQTGPVKHSQRCVFDLDLNIFQFTSYDRDEAVRTQYWQNICAEKSTEKSAQEACHEAGPFAKAVHFTKNCIDRSSMLMSNLTLKQVAEDLAEHQTVLNYQLVSVVVHSGGASGGHYTCYRRLLHEETLTSIRDYEQFLKTVLIKNDKRKTPRLSNKWVYISDEEVKVVDEKEVLKAQAYILFYEREE
jgi:hypothetical protein